jgi:predicted thioesterase
MQIGSKNKCQFSVQQRDLALELGSGNLPVYGTPAMIAHMENTAMKHIAPFLTDAQSSVGILINAKHIKASPLGEIIEIISEVTLIDNKRIEFSIKAFDSKQALIGEASHQRVIIDVEKFMSRV